MELLTWGEIKAKIQRKHGIETDDSYDELELLDMYNEAANKIESKLIKLNQDYFKTMNTINVVVGLTEYNLPSNIYASKVRRLMYLRNGYEATRLYPAKSIDDLYDNNKLRYDIINYESGRKLILNKATANATIHIYYTRNTNRFTSTGGDSQICDIPEYADAVMAWMSYLVEFKDKSPAMAHAKDDYNTIVQDMTDTLAVALNDEDNVIEPDTTLWEDHA